MPGETDPRVQKTLFDMNMNAWNGGFYQFIYMN